MKTWCSKIWQCKYWNIKSEVKLTCS